MPTLYASLVACAALASALYLLRYCRLPPSLAKSLAKTSATAMLAAAALAAGGPGWLIVALALGALGDLMLSREGERAFLAGLVAFAAAHLAYIVLFVVAGKGDLTRLTESGLMFPVILLLVFGAVMARLLWSKVGSLRWPVTGYIGIILAMGLTALALPEAAGQVALVASLLFIASDAILAAERFLLPNDHPAGRITPIAIWLFYWSAQALFLLAFLPQAAM